MGDISKNDIAEALQRTRGNLSGTAKALGTHRHVVHTRVHSDVDLLALYTDLREGVIDQAESNLFNSVEEGSMDATRFILTSLGKSRGYAARSEISGPDGAPLVPKSMEIVFVSPKEHAESESSPS